jgi:UDP-glucose 4-epimerase
MTRTALVTGAAGFIGSSLVRSLASAGYRVYGLDRTTPDKVLRARVTEWSVGDLSQGAPVDLPAADEVYHCAGSGMVGPSFGDPAADFRANVATTASLVAWMAGQRGARLVLVSSAAVYGVQPAMPIDETAPLNPTSPYGVHKRLAERQVRDYARNFGFDAVVVRLFSVYGPGLRKQLLWEASAKLLQGTPSFGGDGSEERDWIHVDDAAQLLMKAAAVATSDCPTYNGGTGTSTTVRDVLGLLARKLGCVDSLRFSGETRRGDPPALVASVAAARGIGWAPKVALAEGIAQYANWFRSAVR